MSNPDPFFVRSYNGHDLYHITATDRLARVKTFDLAQCRAALAQPHLQKTVRAAIERRQRALQRRIAQTLRAIPLGPERGR